MRSLSLFSDTNSSLDRAHALPLDPLTRAQDTLAAEAAAEQQRQQELAQLKSAPLSDHERARLAKLATAPRHKQSKRKHAATDATDAGHACTEKPASAVPYEQLRALPPDPLANKMVRLRTFRNADTLVTDIKPRLNGLMQRYSCIFIEDSNVLFVVNGTLFIFMHGTFFGQQSLTLSHLLRNTRFVLIYVFAPPQASLARPRTVTAKFTRTRATHEDFLQRRAALTQPLAESQRAKVDALAAGLDQNGADKAGRSRFEVRVRLIHLLLLRFAIVVVWISTFH